MTSALHVKVGTGFPEESTASEASMSLSMSILFIANDTLVLFLLSTILRKQSLSQRVFP
jgi:hypothetical protein